MEVRVSVNMVRLLLSSIPTFTLLFFIQGRTLVGPSVNFYLELPQFANSSARTVERHCRGLERITLLSVLSGLAIRELLLKFFHNFQPFGSHELAKVVEYLRKEAPIFQLERHASIVQ